LNPDSEVGNPVTNVGVAGFDGPVNIRTPNDLSEAGQAEPLSQTFNRIWVVPNAITLNNPQIGVPVNFTIWNAYLEENTLLTLSGDVAGILVTPNVGTVFAGLQQIDGTLTVTASAPPSVNTTYVFNFELGVGRLEFNAIIVEFVASPPEEPLIETWAWLTNIITAFDGSEDRISLRQEPRFSLQFRVFIDEPLERRSRFIELANNIRSRALIPYFQYLAPITVRSAIGANRIFFNPALTSIRDNQFILIIDETRGIETLVQVDAMQTDGATLVDTLTIEVLPQSTIVVPTVNSLIQENATISTDIVSGLSNVTTEDLTPTTEFVRTGANVNITTFNSRNVLDRRPLLGNEETFLSGKEVIRGDDTALRQIDTAFPRTFVVTNRTFRINRYGQPDELDYWRQFLSDVQGRRILFYHATYLTDLSLALNPGVGSSQITINEADYEARFFPFETYKQLRFETRDGNEFYATVESVNGTVLNLSIALTQDQIDIVKISYLNLVRLATDDIRLEHRRIYTDLSISVRNIDA